MRKPEAESTETAGGHATRLWRETGRRSAIAAGVVVVVVLAVVFGLTHGSSSPTDPSGEDAGASGATAGAAVFTGAHITAAVPVKYTVDLRWHPKSRRLAGSSTIILQNSGTADLGRVWLRLWPNAFAHYRNRPCQAQRERLRSVVGGAVGEYRRGCSAVAVNLAPALGPGERATVRLNFATDLPKRQGSFGHNAGLDLIGNALPILAVTDDRGVHLEPQAGFGEPYYSSVADWRVRVQVPRGLKVAMTGQESRAPGPAGGAVYTSTAEGVRDFAIAIGHFTARSTMVGGVRIRALGSRRMAGRLDVALARTKRAFKRMNAWYGNYALRDLDVVLGTLSFGGMEYPGIVFSTPDKATVSHEVAHQWFYGITGNNQYSSPWLDESLTSWNEQQLAPTYRCDPSDPLDGSPVGLGEGMGYWSRHPGRYVNVIYRGGSCALTRLERGLGRGSFLAALRLYAHRTHNGIARTEDFLDAVRAVAPDYNVDAWAKLVGLR